MEDEDDDEVLAWKTLEDPDEHQNHHHSHHHSADHAHVHAHGGGIPSGTDDDVEDFAELAYEHEHERTSTTTVAAAGDAHPPHSLLQLQQHERHAAHSHHSHHHGQHRAQQQRLKRKNFSKQLQLLCLQRYAQYAKEHGKLPDKTECQLLLNQSYLQFLKDGGALDEPRLTHQEFLKLIRNRRREMYVRAQKLKFPHVSSSSANASTVITTSGDIGADNEAAAAAAGGITSQPLSAAKRKLQQEHAKIYELIEIIDQAREQSGFMSDHNHNRQSVRVSQSSQRSGKRRLSTKSAPSQQQQSTVHEHQQHHHHHHQQQQQQQQLVADPQDQICAIFRIQQEMLEIQREIAERLKVIRLHRSLQQHDPMEPSSASV